MSRTYATIDTDDDLRTMSSIIHMVGWADDGCARLEQWFDMEDDVAMTIIGDRGQDMMRGLMDAISEFRTHIAYSLADFLLERAETDPEVIDTVFDLTFAQAMGKLAEGYTVACRATRGRRYRIVDGTLSEVHADGRSYPVGSFDDLQMGSVWRVVEDSE